FLSSPTTYSLFEKLVKGGVVSNLNSDIVKGISVPVPPMAVQEQIVAELDKINEVIADCRELLRNLDALAQSLFYDYFGDPNSNPKGWEVKKLVDICKAISTGITYKPENVANTGTIVLRSSNIQNSAFVLNDIVRINMLLKPSQYVKKNDILMCSRNGSARLVGKVALIPEINENMSWGAFMTIIRSDFHHFLFQYFHLPAFRGQLTKTKTTTVNQITIGMLKQIQLPVPPLELQEKFAARIEQIEEQKKAVEQTIAELQTLLDSRMDYWFN
ncbi:MAG: restriction endonuclease subunit S, partial [Spirochaetia bacterium]|nr:restriction endonuclease subunit S [Spirochaetia bacterium]